VRTELVGGRDAPVLRGINSARISLKQESERTERALLAAETLAALAQLRFGTKPPLAELRLAWREQLRNLPHDSISGCSIDEVHRDMRQRVTTAQRIATRISAESMAALAGRRAPWVFAAEPSAAVSLVNTLAWPRRVVAELRLPAELDATDVAAVIGDDVRPVQQLIAAEPGAGRTVIVAADVDGYGARDVRVVAASGSTRDGRASAGRTRSTGPDTITNGLLTVRAATDGTLEVTDERTGRVHRGLHRFEDVADRGDEYTFCPVEFDEPIWAERAGTVSVSADGPVVAELTIALELDLPDRLAEDRRRRVGRCVVPATIRVRLVDGIDRVEIVTTLDNRARDHRLRVRFPATAANDVSPIRAEGQFAIVDRAARPTWGGGGWTEPPALTAHTSGLAATGELAVIGRGLPEYEAVPTKDGVDLALTLLRCVGWLSRDDLSTRPGGAGPTIATPDAQCLGAATFEYALRFDAASSSNNDLLRQSADYRTSIAVGPAGAEADDRPTLLAVDGDVVATALKPADDGTGAILRVANANGHGEAVGVGGSWVATAVRMDETPLSVEPAADLRPGEIRTLRVTGG
jgi:alpha-mannosidase